jgi:hypothetical protein
MKLSVRNSILFSVSILGLCFVGYYTYYLRRQELRDWREIRVAFSDVGGLKEKSPVMINGAAMGRVRTVRMYKNQQLVILDVEPGLLIHAPLKAEIVSTSALGFVGVQITPGKDGPLLVDDPTIVHEGAVRADIGGSVPGPARQRELQRQMDDWAVWSKGLKNPEAGIVGSLVYDRQRRLDFEEALDALEQTWIQLDDGLEVIENSASITAEDTLDAFEASAMALNDTFTGMRDSLRETRRGESGASAFVADAEFAHGWKRALVNQERVWDRNSKGEGTVGGLIRRDDLYVGLANISADLNEKTGAGVRGEGNFGLLSSPVVGEEVRNTLQGMATGLKRFERSPLVNSASAKNDVEDLLGDVDDGLSKLRRALKGLRRGLPDRRFQGVLFAVF